MKVERNSYALSLKKWKFNVKIARLKLEFEVKEMPFTIFIRKGIQIYAVNQSIFGLCATAT